VADFKPGDRVRQIAHPDKPATVQQVHGTGWMLVRFDAGGGQFGNGLVDVPVEHMELVPGA